MKYYLFILGCQMNKADAERVSAVLDKLGLNQTQEEKEADLIIVLACSVRQSAVDRIFGKIKKWRQEKKKRKLTVWLTGCLLPKDREKFKRQFDRVFPIKNLAKIPGWLKKPLPLPADYLCLPPKRPSKFSAFVPIMTGCDNYCTYCAVPYTRGSERSRPQEEIIKEIKGLVKKGYQEIILLGQNVNSYGHKKGKVNPDNRPFIKLLAAINQIPGRFLVYFISNHPKDMTGDLIRQLPKLEKIAPYIHLPLQSGDDEIIKKMNRHYTVRQYLKIIYLIRKTIPCAAITSDLIVGFPGETKKQFENTLKVAKAAQFDQVYTAQYSERPGTAAARLTDDVPKEEKKRREQELTQIIEKTALENNKKLLGTEQEILVDGQKEGYYYGRTKTWKVVKFKANKKLIGQFVRVKIIKAEPWKLTAEIIK